MFGWVEKIFTGYSSADLQAESDDLDAKLRQQNELAHERGVYNDSQYDEAQADVARGQINASAEIGGAFKEGFQEGVTNVRNTIGDVVTSPLQLISWKIWVVGAVALFFYMGGGLWLKGILPRKLK